MVWLASVWLLFVVVEARRESRRAGRNPIPDALIDGDSLRRSVGSLPTIIRRFRLVAFLDWKRHHTST